MEYKQDKSVILSNLNTHPTKGETMKASLRRCQLSNELMMTVEAENELESIALERWMKENKDAIPTGLEVRAGEFD